MYLPLHIKEDYGGEYPSYPRRAFDLAVDRCIARMKKQGKYKPEPPAAMSADQNSFPAPCIAPGRGL